jgi:spermine oxidase
VHGEAGNTVFELVDGNFNFGDTGFESANYFFHHSNGAALNQTIVGRLFYEAISVLEDYNRMMMDRGKLGEYFHREFIQRLQRPDMSEVPFNLAMSVQDFIHERICSYFGTDDWNRLETRLYAKTEGAEGNQWLTWRDRGFHTLFNIIQSPREGTFFNVTDRVQLNKVVSTIHWNPDAGRTRVHCTDGTQYTADHVIVTTSLGVLKERHSTLFQPMLPTWKRAAIQHMEYGSLEKVFLEYLQPFWPVNDPSWVQFSILWSRDDIAEARGTEREW